MKEHKPLQEFHVEYFLVMMERKSLEAKSLMNMGYQLFSYSGTGGNTVEVSENAVNSSLFVPSTRKNE